MGTVDNMPGALAPMGFFDPLGFAAKADEQTLRCYREAEVTHGRVAMLAVLGFLVGEAVEGSSFLSMLRSLDLPSPTSPRCLMDGMPSSSPSSELLRPNVLRSDGSTLRTLRMISQDF